MKKVKKVIQDKYEKYFEKGLEIFSKLIQAKLEAEERDKIIKKFIVLGIIGIIGVSLAVYFGLKR